MLMPADADADASSNSQVFLHYAFSAQTNSQDMLDVGITGSLHYLRLPGRRMPPRSRHAPSIC